jgi:cytochrome b
MAEGQDSRKKITITIKTYKEKQSIEIEEDATIKDVSAIIINILYLIIVVHLQFAFDK